MFKQIFLIASLVFVSTVVHARSLHPCTPIVSLQPNHQTCFTEENAYQILIQPIASRDIDQCQGENRVVLYRANIDVYAIGDYSSVINSISLFYGEFSFSLSTNDGTFTSEKYDLDLQGCKSPLNGAFSAGN